MLLVLATLSALAGPGDYTVDASDSMVYALVWRDGAAAALAHDHAVRARDLSGTVHWEEAGRRSAKITVETSGLSPDEDEVRALAGLEGSLKSSQRDSILSSILDEDQLWAKSFPSIVFETTSIEPRGGEWLAKGRFTLRGASRTLEAPVTVVPDGDGLRVKGRFSLTQSHFGYAPYSAAFGALRVKDQVDVVLDLALDPVE